MTKSTNNNAGKYTILAAIIGLTGTILAVFINDYLETKRAGDNQVKPNEEKAALVSSLVGSTGKLHDERDGKYYDWVILKDGKQWMQEDLNFNMQGSFLCRAQITKKDDTPRHYPYHLSSRACPEGWQVPTLADWENLLMAYGAAKNESGFLILNYNISGLNLNPTICHGKARRIHGKYQVRDTPEPLEVFIDFWTDDKVRIKIQPSEEILGDEVRCIRCVRDL